MARAVEVRFLLRRGIQVFDDLRAVGVSVRERSVQRSRSGVKSYSPAGQASFPCWPGQPFRFAQSLAGGVQGEDTPCFKQASQSLRERFRLWANRRARSVGGAGVPNTQGRDVIELGRAIG